MEAALPLARFAHFASLLGLSGALFYVSALAPAGLLPEMAPGLRKFAPVLALLALASAILWAGLVARDMADAPLSLAIFAETLNDTAFGAVWRVRLIGLAALLALTMFPDPRWRAPMLLAGAASVSLALVGHAAMQTGALGLAHRFNAALHLLFVAYWVGGLPPFLASLQILGRERQRREPLAAMVRFSRLGHFVVPGLFLTGVLNVALTTQAFPWPPNSPYRAGLAAKFAIFCAMTGLALLNRYVFAPKALRRDAFARALAAGTLAEIALALAALALVSGFATFAPR